MGIDLYTNAPEFLVSSVLLCGVLVWLTGQPPSWRRLGTIVLALLTVATVMALFQAPVPWSWGAFTASMLISSVLLLPAGLAGVWIATRLQRGRMTRWLATLIGIVTILVTVWFVSPFLLLGLLALMLRQGVPFQS